MKSDLSLSAPSFIPLLDTVHVELGGVKQVLFVGQNVTWNRHGRFTIAHVSDGLARITNEPLSGEQKEIEVERRRVHISNGRFEFSDCDYERLLADVLVERILLLPEASKRVALRRLGVEIEHSIVRAKMPHLSSSSIKFPKKDCRVIVRVDRDSLQILGILSPVDYGRSRVYNIARAHRGRVFAAVYDWNGCPEAVFSNGKNLLE